MLLGLQVHLQVHLAAVAAVAAAIFVVMLVPSSDMQRPGRFRPYARLSGPQLLPRWGLWRQRLLERDRDQGLLHGSHLVHRILWPRWGLVDVPWRVRLADARAQLQDVHEATKSAPSAATTSLAAAIA